MHDHPTGPTPTIDDRSAGRGRIVGVLETGEDREAIVHVLRRARELVDNGNLSPLCHEDLEPAVGDTDRDRARDALRIALRAGKLKHFALRVSTTAGARIVKVAEANTVGGQLLGVVGISRGAREHRLHTRAEQMGVAAARTLGFLELRRGALLVRSCQVQTEVPPAHVPLGVFMARAIATLGPRAAEPFGRALAETHRVPFFHSDLKPFHAFVSDLRGDESGPTSYRLRWIDLDRVAFWISRRKRVINLYQALRYVVPDEPETQRRFVTAYCQASGWYADAPGRALATVRRFLNYKLRTHPHP